MTVLLVVIVWAVIALAVALVPWLDARARYIAAEARVAKLEHENARAEELLRACARELAPSVSPREAAFAAMLAGNLPPRDKP